MSFNEMLPNGVSGLTMLELRKGLYAAVPSGPGGMYSLKISYQPVHG